MQHEPQPFGAWSGAVAASLMSPEQGETNGEHAMILPVALYTTTIGPTGQQVSDGWLSAGTEIRDIDATIGGSDITVTITIGGGLAPEQVRMTPAELATFAGHVALEDSAAADYLQHTAEQAAEEMGWQA